MYKGEYQYTLDDKGRVVIPPKFRRTLGDQFVLTRGVDACLFAYSHDEWAQVEQKLGAQPLGRREFVRFLVSGAVDVEADRQGRVVIPAHLRQYAGIDRDVVVVGVLTRVEIWSKPTWDAHVAAAAAGYSQAAEEMDLSL